MAATNVRRHLAANKDYTHTLLIKLAESSFLPQFETVFQRFRRDVLAKNIPEKAFKPPLPPLHANLLLGRLNLKSPRRREQFSKVLHGLDHDKLIGPAPESAQLSSVARKNVDTARSLSYVAPLRIKLSGLTTDRPDASSTRVIYLLPIDPTGRLQPYLRSLIDIFTAAGFPILRPNPHPEVRFVDTYAVNWLRSGHQIVQPDGRRRYKRDFRVPAFDARELLKKYENETWATDVCLERLSLKGVGASERNPDGEMVLKETPEIDSVILPR